MESTLILPRIESYWITILAFLYAAEYIGRLICLHPKNPLWAGKALAGLYLGASYLLTYFNVEADLRHALRGYGLVLFLGINVYYFIAEHVAQIIGIDRRNRWPLILFGKGKKQ